MIFLKCKKYIINIKREKKVKILKNIYDLYKNYTYYE